MEVMQQIHTFLQVSLRCCFWSPVESEKRKRFKHAVLLLSSLLLTIA